ncbi:MAG: zinc metallopeptidase [Planctomycetes bacterium]|nr:zinc metallopeptidase [Planctomycetota bacterium]
MIFDFQYLLFAGPGIILALIAQAYVKKAYAEASKIRSRSGYTGAEIAEMILKAHNISDVGIEPTHGVLTDHYHPVQKKLRLSEGNYSGESLAAIGVSAHEVGHAIQHKQNYFPMYIRSALVPISMMGSNFSYILFMIGMFMSTAAIGKTLMLAAIIMFATCVLFAIVTIPVEIDASRRALKILVSNGILGNDEIGPVKKVLTAAALTYIAAAVQALLILLYFVMRYMAASRDD